jgi:hypothetical protein
MKDASTLRHLPHLHRLYQALCACLVIVAVVSYALAPAVGAQSPEPTPEPTPTPDDSTVTIELPPQGPPPGDTSDALAVTPGGPVAVDPNDPNKRYVLVNGQRVALVGVSGDYIPHVPLLKRADGSTFLFEQSVKVQEQCSYDTITNDAGLNPVPKFRRCINLLKAAGLNKMRLYVSLNHSPGKMFAAPNGKREPYERETPFVWNPSTKRWNLMALDNTDAGSYFDRLYEVVSYAQQQGVIVEVSLFNPWDGDLTTSPYKPANNSNNIGFTSDAMFVQGERLNFTYDFQPTTIIDNLNSANYAARDRQLAVMRAAVDKLYDLDNFYWELANEADRHDGVGGQPFLNWHYYMAKQLRLYEESKRPAGTPVASARKHLIAVNFSLKAETDQFLANTQAKQLIDIVNGHYVRLGDSGTPLAQPRDPFGATEILRNYDKYNANTGVQNATNNKIWGFDEGRYTGLAVDPISYHSIRAEAWEFMLGGGGIYDHLSYNWGNLKTGYNQSDPNNARDNLSYLKKVLDGSGDLAAMKKLATWVAGPPVYGNPTPPGGPGANVYWAAMRGDTTFLYYQHHGFYSNHGGATYTPINVTSSYTAKLSVQKLGGCPQSYTAEWLRPDNHDPSTGAPIPAPTPVKTETFNWSPGQTRLLRLRNYRESDFAVRVKRNSTTCAAPSTVPGPNVALAANGGVASASSTNGGAAGPFAPRFVNDGVRTAANWGAGGGWNDATESAYPDWVRVDFNGPKTISEINVVTLQDNYAAGAQPTTDELFSLYGITDYDVEYLDPATGLWEPVGGVTANTNVWRNFKFESVTTSAIRVVVSASAYPSPSSYSRIVEVEAY